MIEELAQTTPEHRAAVFTRYRSHLADQADGPCESQRRNAVPQRTRRGLGPLRRGATMMCVGTRCSAPDTPVLGMGLRRRYRSDQPGGGPRRIGTYFSPLQEPVCSPRTVPHRVTAAAAPNTTAGQQELRSGHANWRMESAARPRRESTN